MQNQPKIFKNKKILIAVGAVIIITIIAIGTVTAIKIANDNATKKQSATELKTAADELKSEAIKAQKNDNDAAAIKLLEDAKSKYDEAGDKNNSVDSEALIFLSNYEQ